MWLKSYGRTQMYSIVGIWHLKSTSVPYTLGGCISQRVADREVVVERQAGQWQTPP
jgi:hypothetical protein